MDFPSDSAQKRLLNAGFSGQLLTNTLMGAYTVVFLGTSYVYLRKSSKSSLVFACIVLLYVAYITQVAIEWYSAKEAFVNNGTTREATFISFFFAPGWETYVSDICTFLIAVFADALLIWRCYYVWNRSLRAIVSPSFFLLSEIGLDFAVIVIAPVAHFNPSPSQIHILNALIGSSLFVASAATISSTILIAYRIHSTSRNSVLKASRSRFNHILEILAESAAIYAIATLALAIESVMPQTSNNTLVVLVCNAYLTPLYAFIAGVAPTIMVARVALAPDKPADISAISHISGLHFRSTVLASTQRGQESMIPVNGNSEDSEKASTKHANAISFD